MPSLASAGTWGALPLFLQQKEIFVTNYEETWKSPLSPFFWKYVNVSRVTVCIKSVNNNKTKPKAHVRNFVSFLSVITTRRKSTRIFLRIKIFIVFSFHVSVPLNVGRNVFNGPSYLHYKQRFPRYFHVRGLFSLYVFAVGREIVESKKKFHGTFTRRRWAVFIYRTILHARFDDFLTKRRKILGSVFGVDCLAFF